MGVCCVQKTNPSGVAVAFFALGFLCVGGFPPPTSAGCFRTLGFRVRFTDGVWNCVRSNDASPGKPSALPSTGGGRTTFFALDCRCRLGFGAGSTFSFPPTGSVSPGTTFSFLCRVLLCLGDGFSVSGAVRGTVTSAPAMLTWVPIAGCEFCSTCIRSGCSECLTILASRFIPPRLRRREYMIAQN
ncbi:hypothetical protein KC19_4G031000 [Ceratodon purpureus]|uniref:Secreted protein n=1 Tax=Ceratodon purpureus TaxID=3225 RepID=A0A8T0I5Z2_CERPU|nr:hypothetical protein KC19_4G031000 [Ceratodon purpureus]